MDSQTGSIHRNLVTELYFEGLRSIKKKEQDGLQCVTKKRM